MKQLLLKLALRVVLNVTKQKRLPYKHQSLLNQIQDGIDRRRFGSELQIDRDKIRHGEWRAIR